MQVYTHGVDMSERNLQDMSPYAGILVIVCQKKMYSVTVKTSSSQVFWF